MMGAGQFFYSSQDSRRFMVLLQKSSTMVFRSREAQVKRSVRGPAEGNGRDRTGTNGNERLPGTRQRGVAGPPGPRTAPGRTVSLSPLPPGPGPGRGGRRGGAPPGSVGLASAPPRGIFSSSEGAALAPGCLEPGPGPSSPGPGPSSPPRGRPWPPRDSLSLGEGERERGLPRGPRGGRRVPLRASSMLEIENEIEDRANMSRGDIEGARELGALHPAEPRTAPGGPGRATVWRHHLVIDIIILSWTSFGPDLAPRAVRADPRAARGTQVALRRGPRSKLAE